MNKVKYGLKNVHYAVARIGTNGEPTYEKPKAIPGAVSLSLDPQGDQSTFYADDSAYYVTNANNGYSGDLEFALIPEDFRQDILGEALDGNGVMIEDANSQAIHFALMFEFSGDERATRHVLYNCTAARPNMNSQTKEETIEVQTETVTVTATTAYFSTLDKTLTKASTGATTNDTVYSGWYDAVYTPALPDDSGEDGDGGEGTDTP